MRMLICTIGSKQRSSTLRFASQVAEALTADTTLLGVVDKKRRASELEQVLQEVALNLSERELPVQFRVTSGDAEDLVMEELETAPYDLVVLGSLGKKRSHRRLFDSVAMSIVERAQSSVLVYRGDRSHLSRLLICTSGTEYGHQAVWAGASLACGAEAEATVLHVVNAMPSMYAGLERMEETQRLKIDKTWRGIDFNTDGTRLFVSGGNNDQVNIYRFQDGALSLLDSIILVREAKKGMVSITGIDYMDRSKQLLVVSSTRIQADHE